MLSKHDSKVVSVDSNIVCIFECMLVTRPRLCHGRGTKLVIFECLTNPEQNLNVCHVQSLCTFLSPFSLSEISYLRLWSHWGQSSESIWSKDGHLPWNEGRKRPQFQWICTGLVALRGQRLSEHERRTEWLERDRKDTANDYLVQTCLYYSSIPGHRNCKKETSVWNWAGFFTVL